MSQFRVIAIEQMGHGRTADVVDRPFHDHDMAEDTVDAAQRRAAVVPFAPVMWKEVIEAR